MQARERAGAGNRWALLVVAAGVVLLAPGILWEVPFGKGLVGASRVLRGELPYRDFWTMYAPGMFYLQAGLFVVAGREVWVQGLGAVLLTSLSAGVFFSLQRRQSTPIGVSLALSALFLAMFWRTSPELTSYPPALLAILASLHGSLRYLRGDRSAPVFASGLWLGAAAVFKHDVAFYAAGGTALAFAVAWLSTRAAERPSAWLPPLRATLRLAAGAIVVALPVAVWLAVVAGPQAWESLIVFPATDFPRLFGEQYPAPLPLPLGALATWLASPADLGLGRGALHALGAWSTAVLPEVFFACGVLVLLVGGRRIAVSTRCSAILWLALLPPFWWAAHTQQNTHIYSMAVLGLLLFGLAWNGLAPPVSRWGRPAALALLVLYAVGLAAEPAESLFVLGRRWAGGEWLELPGARGVRASARTLESVRPIIDFVRQHVPEDEPVYVGVVRHDAVVINNQRFYWLADRPIPVRHNELHPGFADSEAGQREIIADLEASGVRCAVLWDFGWPAERLDAIRERRRRAVPGMGATLLNDYFRDHFDTLSTHDEYRLLWRRGAPRPGEE